MDTYFLQFYYKRPLVDNYYFLQNGFSDTWDFCKNKGDFLWLERAYCSESLDEGIVSQFPVDSGTVYVSSTYKGEMFFIQRLARNFPKINFIVGGFSGSYLFEHEKYYKSNNFKVICGSVEEYFNIPNFSYEWKLEIPKELETNIIDYNYTMDLDCYWRRCTFCNVCNINYKRIRPIKIAKTHFEKISGSKKEFVRMGCLCLTPKIIRTWLPKITFENDMYCDLYIRSDRQTIKLLKEYLPAVLKANKNTTFFFHIGVEYPSNKLLKIMNKGITEERIIETILYLNKYDNVRLAPSFIIGWPELDEQDLEKLEKILNIFKKKQTAYVYCLCVEHLAPISKIYPSTYTYWYPIGKESNYKKELNLRALDILKNHFTLLPFEENLARKQIIGET